jgi:hypothetical protein
MYRTRRKNQLGNSPTLDRACIADLVSHTCQIQVHSHPARKKPRLKAALGCMIVAARANHVREYHRADDTAFLLSVSLLDLDKTYCHDREELENNEQAGVAVHCYE